MPILGPLALHPHRESACERGQTVQRPLLWLVRVRDLAPAGPNDQMWLVCSAHQRSREAIRIGCSVLGARTLANPGAGTRWFAYIAMPAFEYEKINLNYIPRSGDDIGEFLILRIILMHNSQA